MLLGLLGSFATSFLAKAVSQIVGDLWASWRSEQVAKEAGRAEAMAESQGAALQSIATARQVEADAEARNRADPSDAAFDQSFKRD